jgi:hypothetical protein
VINRDVDTAFGDRIKQAIKAKTLHKGEEGERVGVLALVSFRP